jgi:hypothetical protein
VAFLGRAAAEYAFQAVTGGETVGDAGPSLFRWAGLSSWVLSAALAYAVYRRSQSAHRPALVRVGLADTADDLPEDES